MIIKISDLFGGFPRQKTQKIFDYYYSNTKEETQLSGYGVGLPLARVYSRFFGGDLIIIPYDGIGTDALIFINRINPNEQYL